MLGQQFRHRREVEQSLVRATESLLQVRCLEGDCRSREVRPEYGLETQDQRIDANACSLRLLALHHGPRMPQEPGRQPGIAPGQFAIDRQCVAHGRHFAPPRIVDGGTRDSPVPGLQQRARRSCSDGFPDQALDMQRALAHRLAPRALRRRCSQCAIHGGGEGDDVLPGSCRQHDGKIVTNRLEIAVTGQQGGSQPGRQQVLRSGIVRLAAREMEDDLRPELTVHGYCGQTVNLSNSPSSALRTSAAERNLPAPRRSS